MFGKMPVLLDELSEKAGCDYLSDLHDNRFAAQVLTAVATLDADAFSLSDWEDALHYITGEKKTVATPEEAKNVLSSWLGKKKM